MSLQNPIDVVSRETFRLIHESAKPSDWPMGSALAMVLSEKSKTLKGRLLVVFPQETQISMVRDDLESLNSALDVFHYEEINWDRLYSEETELRLLSERAEALRLLQEKQQSVILLSTRSLIQKVPPPKYFFSKQITIRKGTTVPFMELVGKLESLGYEREVIVSRPGDYAIRGGLLDVYSYGAESPVRIDFWGDVAESIREFDPSSQRSTREEETTVILPGFKAERSLQNQVCLLEYLQPEDHLIIFDVENQKKTIGDLNNKAVFSQSGYAVNLTGWDELTSYFELLTVHQPRLLNDHPLIIRQGTLQVTEKKFIDYLKSVKEDGCAIYLSYDLDAQWDRIRIILETHQLESVAIPVKPSVHEGFILPTEKIILLAEHHIFDRYRKTVPKHHQKIRADQRIRSIADIRRGDFVVHEDHGIGKFIGLTSIKIGDNPTEVIRIEFQNKDVLFLNVKMVEKIARYRPRESAGLVELNRLGAPEWVKKRQQTKNKIKEYARELIGLYGKRKESDGYEFSPNTAWQAELEASFMYVDTPDQEKAWKDVSADMEEKNPMDRLVCGDVGFGKTEIAVRAAFKAVQDTKQVAILVPTTILAEQHFLTFSKRMEAFPVKVDVISRFRTPAEIKEIKEKLKAGSIDIIIGTTSLLGSDIQFKDLGLLVIDEEHRFGVKEKERIKSLKANVDVLALSATPIPRTLQLSMMGARDLSIIATPPVNRKPIFVSVEPFDEAKIKAIILDELTRGGQVFFIHNRVKSIYAMAGFLQRILPRIRVQVAHGKMSGKDLEDIMHAFVSKEIDVLLSTNIVESGVDIPNANTIIINRADRFGLAELYQLKGRVGRSNIQGYCYLMVPPISMLKKDAIRRLLTIEEFTELGSGFSVAMRDLDLRGAGNILGMEQSGFTETMGLEMYHRLLEEAMDELKDEEFSDLFKRQTRSFIVRDVIVESDQKSEIPESFIDEPSIRFGIYQRLSSFNDIRQVEILGEELEDRFGALPPETMNLLFETRLKLIGRKIGTSKIQLTATTITLTFPEKDHSFFKNGYFEKLLDKLTGIHYPHSFSDQKGILRLTIKTPEWKGLDPTGRSEKTQTLLFSLKVV